jgi:hypothetical protein
MAKRITQLDDTGRIVTHTLTRHQRKSEQHLIGWTAGPQTRWQKLMRAAIG